MIILDTHAWVWWANRDDRLTSTALQRIESEPVVGICAISCWEVAMLATRGRIHIEGSTSGWIDDALNTAGVRLLPLSPYAATLAGGDDLRWEHRDPADRMIAASAIEHIAPVVTRDQAMHDFSRVITIW